MYVQYDDNTPLNQAPFTNEPSTWDLHWDLAVAYGLEEWVWEVLKGESPFTESIDPLSRGLPKCEESNPVQYIAGENQVGWLDASEFIPAAHSEAGSLRRSIGTRVLISVLETLSEHCGPDRVRIVYALT